MSLLESVNKRIACLFVKNGTIEDLQWIYQDCIEELESNEEDDSIIMVSFYKGTIAAINTELARRSLVVHDIVEVKGVRGVIVGIDEYVARIKFDATETTTLLNNLKKVEGKQ